MIKKNLLGDKKPTQVIPLKVPESVKKFNKKYKKLREQMIKAITGNINKKEL